MKIIKSKNGKAKLVLSKNEWLKLGQDIIAKEAQSDPQRAEEVRRMQKNAQEQQKGILDVLYDDFQAETNAGSMQPVYVSLYKIERSYGGPEEGGWWYDWLTLEATKKFYDREEAQRFADGLQRKIDNGGLNDEPLHGTRGFDYPSPSDTDPMYEDSDDDIPLGFSGDAKNYIVYVEDNPGENASTERPRYE